MHVDEAFAGTVLIILIVQTITPGGHRRDTVHIVSSALLVRLERVPDVRVVLTVTRVVRIQVLVIHTAIYPDRDIEPVHTVTYVHHRVMLLLLQIVIRHRW